MKRYLIKVVILLAILTMAFRMAPMPSAAADKPSISDVYVSITDAKSILEDKSKSDKDKKQAIKDIDKQLDTLKIKNTKQGKDVKQQWQAVKKTSSTESQAAKLSEVTKSLIAYENAESSGDASKKIKELQQQVDAKDSQMQQAIKDKDETKLQSINNSLNQIWTSHETVIRNYDDSKYGQIEVNLMQLRVAVQKEPLDINKVKNAWTTFKTSIDQVDQKQSNQSSDKYNVTQLNDELDKAIKGIENNQLKQTDDALSKFIQIWPYVEGKIQTKNASLYTTIEDKIPYYQSILDDSNKDRVKEGLQDIN